MMPLPYIATHLQKAGPLVSETKKSSPSTLGKE